MAQHDPERAKVAQKLDQNAFKPKNHENIHFLPDKLSFQYLSKSLRKNNFTFQCQLLISGQLLIWANP